MTQPLTPSNYYSYSDFIAVPKFKLQTYAFVYQGLMDFPKVKFDYETQTTINLFESIHKIINVKIHLHHSRVTGKIYVYVHNFCNVNVRENQNQFSCIAHSCFGFDMLFLIKGIRLPVWGTKGVNISGTGLTNINFASLCTQVRFIDTKKHFLTSLGNLATTLDEAEKAQVEKKRLQFLNQHSYFSQSWQMLIESQKKQVVNTIVSGKGVIPYEKN